MMMMMMMMMKVCSSNNIHVVIQPLAQEEEKYEAVEKEYEMAAELAKEDELELRYVFVF